jgi:two-component system sensor histidine kinase/response regulator
MKRLELNRFAIYFVVIVLTALSINGVILFYVMNLHGKTLAVQQARHNSLQITYDIEKETAALSRMVRAYTTSGNTKYLTYYYDIIDIRQGKKALPDNYNMTYWTQVMAGEREHVMPKDKPGVSLLERMKMYGFSREEFAAVEKVLYYSDLLYKKDQIAFAATQGLYDPARGVFVDDGRPQPHFANQFVYSSEYLQLESRLAQAVDAFSRLTDNRTTVEVEKVSAQLRRSIFAAITMLGVTVVIVVIATMVIRKMVLAPLKDLMKSALEVGKGDYRNRVDIGQGVSELQALGRTFNAMAQNIQDDILQRDRIQAELELATAKAEESTKTKSLFLANMSHEIRTPMNAIIGMTYLALKAGLNDRQQDYVLKIRDAAQSLLGIVNDILDFSKIEAGKLQLDCTAFQLEGVLSNSLTLLRQRAIEKGLELLLDVKSSALLGNSGTFLGDPLRLSQVLTNLLANAIKFTNTGYVKISIEQDHRSENTCDLRFCVEDTGIGMTSEQMDRLFQEFSQVDGSTTRKHGGTGLGLSISYKLVKQMGGQLKVASRPGAGSTFTFAITLQKPLQSREARSEISCQGVKALIIDDHEPARMVLQTMLGYFGIACTGAESAEDALQLLSRPAVDFDIIFIDWIMPGMGGDELLSVIKDLPFRRQPILVIVSAKDLEVMRQAGGRWVGCHFLSKPLLPVDLRKLLQKTGLLSGAPDPASGTLSEDARLGGMRVLLVEDNLINQQIISELLGINGVHVDCVNNGQEAVDMVTSHADAQYYQAILMDIQMPVMDGYEATRIIRNQPIYHSLPIIAITAHAMVEEQQRCKEIGMNAHISKPIDPEALYRVLAQCHIVAPGPSAAGVDVQTKETPDSCGSGCPRLEGIPGIDLEKGLQHCSGKPDFYRKILRGYINNYSCFHTTLQTLLLNAQWGEIAAAAHTFKGLSGTIGATSLQELGALIEKGGREQSEHLPGLILDLSERLPVILSALNQYIARQEGHSAELTIAS